MAIVTSMSYLFRSIGGVVGISASSAIFQGVVKNILVQQIQGPNAELVRSKLLFFLYTDTCPTRSTLKLLVNL
jgi:hypothetical protein